MALQKYLESFVRLDKEFNEFQIIGVNSNKMEARLLADVNMRSGRISWKPYARSDKDNPVVLRAVKDLDDRFIFGIKHYDEKVLKLSKILSDKMLSKTEFDIPVNIWYLDNDRNFCLRIWRLIGTTKDGVIELYISRDDDKTNKFDYIISETEDIYGDIARDFYADVNDVLAGFNFTFEFKQENNE